MDSGPDNLDAALLRRLDSAHDWFNRHLAPVVEKLHAFDRPGALSILQTVADDLAASDLDDELAAYLRVRLRYVEWQAERIHRPAPEIAALREELLEYLAADDDFQLVIAVRRSYLVQIRTQLLRDEGVSYGSAEFHEHFRQIPRELYTNEFDLYVATWGYLNRDRAVLERVFGDMTVSPGQYQISFVWQAMNLMVQLVHDRATPRDCAEMIKVINHIRNWQFIEKLVWRECLERGLVDAEVAGLLTERLAKLNIDAREFTQHEPRTKRIRRDY